MNVAVYAVTNCRAVPDIPGLRAVRVGRLTALVGSGRRAAATTPAKLRRYHHTMAAIADVLPAVLPVRYGTVMTEPELASLLRARAQSLIAALNRVRGRVQMTVRLTGVPPHTGGTSSADSALGALSGSPRAGPRHAQPAASSGRAYLRALARRNRDIPELDALRRELRSWIEEELVERRGDIVSIYHLVPRRSSAAYARTAARSIAGAGLRGVVSGPFPPYAFSAW